MFSIFSLKKAINQELKTILKIENELIQEKINRIQNIFSHNVEDKIKKYECNKDLVDVSVIIQIPKKKIHIENYLITPAMNMNELKEFIVSYFIKLNDSIQEFNPTTNFLLIVPSVLEKEIGPLLNKNNIMKEISKFQEIIVFPFDQVLLLRSLIKSKVILVIVGDFKLKSDLPPECISYSFQGKHILDYYSCNNCGIKCEYNYNKFKTK